MSSELRKRCRIDLKLLFLFSALLLAPPVYAQPTCVEGLRVEGIVTDPSGAAISSAQVRSADNQQVGTDTNGHFVFTCVPASSAVFTVQADGFATATARASAASGGIADLTVQLTIADVQASVQVTADVDTMDPERGAGTTTLSATDVQQLPDDPDDLLQQLQLLASTGGGAATSATVVVDGFQNGSAMPPKSAIASIRINPDPISPEYQRPGMEGGRIEIITKPGADKYHGAVFFTDSNSIFNATDPFSVTATPAGKRRYGFEFGGPILSQKSGFSLALEKRDINEFNVVNAITLDANQNQVVEQETVAAPQERWIGSARADWQLTEKNAAVLSYSGDVNSLGNQGIGGLVLPEAGYSNYIAEYDLRFADTYTVSANMLHETHIGYTWKRTQQSPNSTDPALQVEGYFSGGGATSQNLNNRERDLEIDDDMMITRGAHSLKFGAQSLGFFIHDYDPDTFNGSYIFGGGSAPVLDPNNNPTGATTTITPIEQYRRALLKLPGGAPTTYQVTNGTPLVPFTQWQLALYGQDSIKLLPRLTVTAGLRYAFQTTPASFNNFAPRFGLAWSPDKNSNWTIHFRAGIFEIPLTTTYAAQAYRLNGTRQQQATVYSPSYNDPLTPVSGSIQVGTIWQFAPSSEEIPVSEYAIGIEHELPHHWHPDFWYTGYSAWGDPRSVNVNAPMVASITGPPPDPTAALLAPRPGAANLNIFEYQNSAHNRGGIISVGISQKSYKHWTLNLGWWAAHFHTDGDTPQSSYSDKGESARTDWQSSGALVESEFHLPWKMNYGIWAYWHYGTPYNITTGTDANGDGTFNDRPSYASALGNGTYATPFGLMTANAVNGDVPRNIGTMPTIVHTYSNLSRDFKFSSDKDRPRTLTLNARAANLLNHTNVTALNTVLSSAAVGQSVAAEAARRVEFGARLSF
ncbi:TonB-dependent receptor [Terracidiphilus gabretensis]|uniref:TonB-dependent receptor n=1 Tax=Terracidiphilus gabretensis TaxID=1577687 RepID=UPI0018D1FA6F|nr:TonB-dependent receptor [Terracidiphilus gabretensis]